MKSAGGAGASPGRWRRTRAARRLAACTRTASRSASVSATACVAARRMQRSSCAAEMATPPDFCTLHTSRCALMVTCAARGSACQPQARRPGDAAALRATRRYCAQRGALLRGGGVEHEQLAGAVEKRKRHNHRQVVQRQRQRLAQRRGVHLQRARVRRDGHLRPPEREQRRERLRPRRASAAAAVSRAAACAAAARAHRKADGARQVARVVQHVHVHTHAPHPPPRLHHQRLGVHRAWPPRRARTHATSEHVAPTRRRRRRLRRAHRSA